ncbi:mucin-5AC-like [Anastrepha ludens]|uniref:mucin-5AC-like n=1 Tax=Anastrepha ludens TaxID=28586 RepID=UPI0023AFC3B6|nr:mucin-5AC-like [Anastrepha ludens]
MVWKSSKEKNPKDSKECNAVVLQDPRMKVRTATAQSETTNTTEQSATIYDNERNKITQRTVRQTVTHQQTAGVTEFSIRRTPTKEELDELLNITGANATFFKSSTPWTKQETTVTQTNGHTQTSFVQQQRTKFNQTGTAAKMTTTTAMATTMKPGAAWKDFANSNPTFANYTDNYRTLSPLRALPPVTTSMASIKSPLSKTTISANSSAINSSLLGKTTRNATTTATGVYPSSLVNSNRSPKSINSNYTASIAPASPSVRAVTSAATKNFAVSRTPLSSAKTTPSLTTTTTGYVSPYANRARGPLASAYTSVYANPSTASNTTYQRHTSADANPTATTTRQQRVITNPTSQNISYTSSTQPQTQPQKTLSAGAIGKKSKLKPGYAVIFNSVDFNDKERFEKRDGSDYDAKLICETFKKYKLNVNTIKNPTVKKIKDVVKSLTQKDYTNYSCLIIAILSHGSAHDSVAASDGEYNVDEAMLHPILDVPSLKEKPKIFIIQACKGALVPGEYKTDASMPRGSPSEILKCYSTFEGYVSYRTEKGSPFVQALCDEIKLKGQNTDIEHLMKNAIETVKIQTRSNQIPCMTTNLTKPFIFGDYL